MAVSGGAAPDAFISRKDGLKYWQSTDSDVNGMLGGFASISRIDLQGSRTFLAKLGIGTKHERKSLDSVLEGGAGIGRITEGLLLRVAKQVDVIEPVAKFTAGLEGKRGVRDVFTCGLEEWRPVEGVQYDLVWVQWCVGYVTDEQLVHFLERCKTVLSPGGLVVLKENTASWGVDVFDKTDSSVTRQDSKFRLLFKQAGLRLVKAELQRGLLEVQGVSLMPVWMYALRA